MKLIREEITFTRGKDPKKSMNIGVAIENRDPIKRLENFKAAFPEVGVSYNSTQATHAGYEKHPHWQIISVEVNNPADGLSLKDREREMVDWLETYTDFDIIEADHTFERRYMPGIDSNPVEQYEQHFTFKMRNEEDIS